MVSKLHLQFRHAHPKVLEKMIGRAYPEAETEVVNEEISKVRCEVCDDFQKQSAAPIVTLPPVARFNNRVTIGAAEGFSKASQTLHRNLATTSFTTSFSASGYANHLLQHLMVCVPEL